ncbi:MULTISPECIES: 50S ribosomal protein L25/general stress protein Ctc [Bacillus]|uniref:Large ribosomal subunit protein bL25 n=1 Tax=Bacillus glycinifermentans TaxID=1664069 RepID=A0AAJ4D0S1_9BACI|nr:MULTISPECIES: 50S ribosomal protein L25/general stress protein Ctc [Bacillus]KKB72762.1 50S ribosomal protein L25 [Bacillus sp. TH008]MBU8788617.1 50S ribosomal protein L25/general stress protein Ctc [Bacillus glycinifermentans]MDU0073013.1 50S ribosomal protein L25/general stress protein Ctc [Bacillus sp. IG6]MED8020793.1 50S ribosomal protein L25/general stress protein Ctc [Bacillus glycinifermentans]NUJ18912.1 50S ribosomal protein L25/general stress protein Ctc [Bacillus glycinifermenta
MAILKAEERTGSKRSSLRKIRLSGFVPGVVYGKDLENKSVSLDSVKLLKILRDEGKNTIINLDVNGEQYPVMVTEVQTDPLKDSIVHADFKVVDMEAEMEAAVPVNLTGEAEGIKQGGVLQQPLYELSVTAKPQNIPQAIEADISHLEVNDVLTVGDIRPAGDYSFNHEPDEVVASILPPQKQEETEAESAAQEVEEPEESNEEEKNE